MKDNIKVGALCGQDSQTEIQTERQTCGAVCVALELSNFSPGGVWSGRRSIALSAPINLIRIPDMRSRG